jgi:hypothetical protein
VNLSVVRLKFSFPVVHHIFLQEYLPVEYFHIFRLAISTFISSVECSSLACALHVQYQSSIVNREANGRLTSKCSPGLCRDFVERVLYLFYKENSRTYVHFTMTLCNI